MKSGKTHTDGSTAQDAQHERLPGIRFASPNGYISRQVTLGKKAYEQVIRLTYRLPPPKPGAPRGPNDLTPEEIAERAAQVRRTWGGVECFA